MVADTIEELHKMADAIGIKRGWFQGDARPHYDISKSKRKLAIRLGAIEVGERKIIEIIKSNREAL